MNNGYLRQRRNLISISIFLLLMILGGTEKNPLYPINLERPFVAELFLWIGFSYFWYRTKIYGPINLGQLFKNEIILRHVIEHDPGTYTHYNLSTFIGTIIVHSENNERTVFTFTGITEAVGNSTPGSVSIPLRLNEILSKRNYVHNIFNGRVVTDYYLPHFIALVVLLVGTYKYSDFFASSYFYIMLIVLLSKIYYSLLSMIDKNF